MWTTVLDGGGGVKGWRKGAGWRGMEGAVNLRINGTFFSDLLQSAELANPPHKAHVEGGRPGRL